MTVINCFDHHRVYDDLDHLDDFLDLIATKRVKKLNCLHAHVDVVYTKVFEI